MTNRQAKFGVFITFTAALLLSPLAASAAEDKLAAKPAPAIELGAPFADNAILQCEMNQFKSQMHHKLIPFK